MPTPDRFAALEFSPTFFRSFASEDFSTADRNQFLKALILLDQNEKHPSLRVHALEGNLDGLWSASASSSLRMTFTRLDGGRKLMLTCSRHYDR